MEARRERYPAPMKGLKLALIAFAAMPASVGLAQTGAPPSPQSGPIAEIVVTADRLGLLEKKPSNTVFGLSKSLLETPVPPPSSAT